MLSRKKGRRDDEDNNGVVLPGCWSGDPGRASRLRSLRSSSGVYRATGDLYLP